MGKWPPRGRDAALSGVKECRPQSRAVVLPIARDPAANRKKKLLPSKGFLCLQLVLLPLIGVKE
jgi:hypothetical protein